MGTNKVDVCWKMKMTTQGSVCPLDGAFYQDAKSLNHHMKTRHANLEKMVTCLLCPKKFKTKKELSNHVRKDFHSSEIFNCEQCTKSFKTKAQLKTHSEHIHQNKTYSCAVCGKALKSRQQIKIHYDKCKANASLRTDNGQFL